MARWHNALRVWVLRDRVLTVVKPLSVVSSRHVTGLKAYVNMHVLVRPKMRVTAARNNDNGGKPLCSLLLPVCACELDGKHKLKEARQTSVHYIKKFYALLQIRKRCLLSTT